MNLSRRNLFLGSLSLVAGSFVPKFLKRGIKDGDKVVFKNSNLNYLGPGILSIENKTHPFFEKDIIWIATVTHNSSWTCLGASSLEKLTSLINGLLQPA